MVLNVICKYYVPFYPPFSHHYTKIHIPGWLDGNFIGYSQVGKRRNHEAMLVGSRSTLPWENLINKMLSGAF